MLHLCHNLHRRKDSTAANGQTRVVFMWRNCQLNGRLHRFIKRAAISAAEIGSTATVARVGHKLDNITGHNCNPKELATLKVGKPPLGTDFSLTRRAVHLHNV